jgi:hypothetical protein
LEGAVPFDTFPSTWLSTGRAGCVELALDLIETNPWNLEPVRNERAGKKILEIVPIKAVIM